MLTEDHIYINKLVDYISPHNFSSPAQASFFLICGGDSTGMLAIAWMLRPGLVTSRAGKIRFSSAQKSMILKPSSGENCAPCHFTRYMCLHHCVPPHAPNEVGYGKKGYGQMKQCNSILQFPHVSPERLPKERKS